MLKQHQHQRRLSNGQNATISAMRMGIVFLALFITTVSFVLLNQHPESDESPSNPKFRNDGAKSSSSNAREDDMSPDLSSPNSEMFCQPNNPQQATTRTPLIIFAMGRTGSNLLFSLLHKVSRHKKNRKDTDLMQLYEHFSDNGPSSMVHAFKGARAVLENCQFGHEEQGLDMENTLSNTMWGHEAIRKDPHGALEFLQKTAQKLPPVVQRWVTLHMNRQKQPSQVIQYLSRIPSSAKKPVFAMKVFDGHLESPEEFIADVVRPEISPKKPKIVILWRRRLIESFVSLEIAHESNLWKDADTKSKVVKLDKASLEKYLRRKRDYYISVRNQLDKLKVPYEVFEYGRDLLTDEGKMKTIQRLQALLDVRQDKDDAKDILSQVSIQKQSGTVPLNDQVSNWDEVVQWGYGGELEEWEDLFVIK